MTKSPANQNATEGLISDFKTIALCEDYLKHHGFKRDGKNWRRGDLMASCCKRRIQGADDGQRVTRRAWIAYWPAKSTDVENLRKSIKQAREY